MIPLSLATVAEIVGGRLEGDDVVVDGPVVIDGREAGEGSLFVAFVGEHTDGHLHVPQAAENGAVAVLGTRATELPTVVVEDPQDALGALAAYVVGQVRYDGRPRVVGLTGSQGKTSTKDLLAAVLETAGSTVATRGSFNNELGMPLTALRVDQATDFLVLEMGARGIGHLAELTDLVAPDVSVVLNVGTAHLGEFGSRDAIAAAKGELVGGLVADGVAVLNADDERVVAMAALAPGRVVTFGTDADADVRLGDVTLDRFGRPAFSLATADGSAEVVMRLVGAHQALNAAAATAAALACGLPLDRVAAALAEVVALSKWRMELHELPGGVVLLNDSYNANPESMRAGIDAISSIGEADEVQRTIAVLGVMRELGEGSEAAHREVGHYAAERVAQVLVIGEDARGIHDGAEAMTTGSSDFVDDNAAAIAWLRENLREGDAVLVKASRGARLDEVAAALL